MATSRRAPVLAILTAALPATATAQAPLRTELVATGLLQPVLVTAPPGDFDRLFVVEKAGHVRIVQNGVVLPTPFLDRSATVQNGGERGLLGLAFHPDYAQNGEFFTFECLPPWPSASVRRYRVSTGNPNVADPASGTDLLTVTAPFGNHCGGHLAFAPDGTLFLGLGDGGSSPPNWPFDPFNHAQRGDSLLGKMLRLDVDNPAAPLLYGIPATNPFLANANVRNEIWAFGLRNPWRFAFDRLTGELWIADVGGQLEEIDVEPAGHSGGRNYGWSCMSGTSCETTACTCNAPTLTLPVHEYTLPGPRAIIGGYVYRGARIPSLRGRYLFADFGHGRFWSCELDAAGTGITGLTEHTVELTPMLPNTLQSPVAFGEDGRGEVYVCDRAGAVYRIAPVTPVVTGVAPYGAGVAGCSGAHTLTAESSPVLGNLAFELRCNHAPNNSLGFMVLGFVPDIAGSDPFGLGFPLHVAVPSILGTLLYASDANGLGRLSFPLATNPGLVGLSLHAQSAWLWDPIVCAPTPGGWSSTHGLVLTIQP